MSSCVRLKLGDEYWLPPDYSTELRVSAAARQAGGVMATPLIRVMNGHIYRVPNRRKRKPELKPSEIPTLLGYTASLVDKNGCDWQQGGVMADLKSSAWSGMR